MAKDLKKAASDCLEFNKHFKAVHVTSDGTCFQHRADAVAYARTLSDTDISVFERDADLQDSEDEVKPLNAKDLIKLMEDADTQEALHLLFNDDVRSTVKAAYAKQSAIIKQAALDLQAKNADEALAQRTNDFSNELAASVTGNSGPVGTVGIPGTVGPVGDPGEPGVEGPEGIESK